MPSRKRPRVLVPVRKVVEIWRSDAGAYERCRVECAPYDVSSNHHLRCAGGALKCTDLSVVYWRYAHDNAALGLQTPPPPGYGPVDDDTELRECRRRLPLALCSGEETMRDARSESATSEAVDEIGTLLVRVDLDNCSAAPRKRKPSATLFARVAVKDATPAARAAVKSGLASLRAMLAGMTFSIGRS